GVRAGTRRSRHPTCERVRVYWAWAQNLEGVDRLEQLRRDRAVRELQRLVDRQDARRHRDAIDEVEWYELVVELPRFAEQIESNGECIPHSSRQQPTDPADEPYRHAGMTSGRGRGAGTGDADESCRPDRGRFEQHEARVTDGGSQSGHRNI